MVRFYDLGGLAWRLETSATGGYSSGHVME